MSPKLTLLLAALALLAAHHANACSCLPPNIKRTYFESSVRNYVAAYVSAEQIFPSAIRYTLNIRKNYKGCTPPKTIVVSTPLSSAACGIKLLVGTTYVLPIRTGVNPYIYLCDFITPFSSLSSADLSFLNTRNVCCYRKCTCASGENPVNCFRQPCSPPDTDNPPCPEATVCVDNYCGGCFAEWFTDRKEPACLSFVA